MSCSTTLGNSILYLPVPIYRKPIPRPAQQTENTNTTMFPVYLKEFYSPLELPPTRQTLKRWVFRL